MQKYLKKKNTLEIITYLYAGSFHKIYPNSSKYTTLILESGILFIENTKIINNKIQPF